jgi:AhpD family alkylhydroperoxidase
MARLHLPPGDSQETDRLFQLSPMGPAVLDLRAAVYSHYGFSVRIFEAVRMRIAQINGCPICLRYRAPEGAAAGLTEAFYDEVAAYATSFLFDAREKLAIEYTEKFLLDHYSIDDAFFGQLKELFTETEIMNLTIVIARHMAFGRITMVMQAEEHCSVDGAGSWSLSYATASPPDASKAA